MKATKVILWLLALLILFLCFYVFFGIYGTPWGKKQQELNMKSYLTKKYHQTFVINKTSYNYLSETYQAYANPKDHPDLLFIVQQDRGTASGYSDMYPKVFWESNMADDMKAKVKEIFPTLDEPTFNVMQIVERGQYFSPNVPTYEQILASPLACSITINIRTNWNQLNQETEQAKINQLNRYIKSIHFPVLVEIRYFETEIHVNEKAFFITEDGKMIDS